MKVTVIDCPEPRDVEVESEGCDYGVMFDDGFTVICIDENDATHTADTTGGKKVARDVYVSAWAEVIE